jgi:predicted nucleotidyltransferase
MSLINKGNVLGKFTAKNANELRENHIYLKKKRKGSNNEGYTIDFTKKPKKNNDMINLDRELENINSQLESDDVVFKFKSKPQRQLQAESQSIDLIASGDASDYSNKGTQNSNEKIKLGKDLGLIEEYNPKVHVEITRSKSTKSKKYKRNKKDNDIILMEEIKLLDKDLIKFSTPQLIIEDSCINSPWLTDKTKKLKGMFKLHQEILDFYEFMKPTSEEDILREETVNKLKELIKTNWPEWRVKKFGSFPNKLHLPDSDVDIVILTENNSASEQLKILTGIEKKLYKADLVDFIRVIEARVPIIRTRLKETKINLDIR